MIQYELFLKEISDFLRSCTIKNNYFAQVTAKKVMTKYGLSSLPDHFNPYYLRMCGLSTLDLVIPTYLYEEDGRRVFNEDYKYRKITDTDPELTQLIMVRLDRSEDDPTVPEPTSTKIDRGIKFIKNQLGLLYVAYTGYTNSDGSPYTGETDIWRIENKPSKVLALQEAMESFNPNDDGIVVNIITGELSWKDLIDNCAVFSNGYTVSNISQVAISTDSNGATHNFINGIEVNLVTGDILNVTSEQCSYIRTTINDREVWVKSDLDNMFDIAVRYYASISGKITATGNSILDCTTFVRTNTLPYVEALIVLGNKNLNWDEMYNNRKSYMEDEQGNQVFIGYNYDTLNEIDQMDHNGKIYGLIEDIEFSKINEYLGYSESKNPQAGSRINYSRNARAWIREDSHGNKTVVYTEKRIPDENDLVYTDTNLTKPLIENGTDVRVFGIDGNIDTIDNDTPYVFMFTTDSGNTEYRRPNINDAAKYHDVALKHATFEFNGIDWIEVPLRNLFEENWNQHFKNEFQSYPKITYTVMSDAYDTESFNEKLIIDHTGRLVLDRYSYHGWDKPVYVPTYDIENDLTKDFTLYTRFCNFMREEHVKTALKYHIGAKVYNDACEKYPEYIDYIKGVCYPAHRHTRDLASRNNRLNYRYITGDNGMPVKVANKSDYDAYISNIELAISEVATDPNFTLEKYDSTLLKENEADSIIECLKHVLKCVRERWDVGEFGYEELYYAAMWTTLWTHLPYLILVQRILNLKTEAVHVDHIWEYLEGKGLKDYRTVMDNEQQLFLYKNIDYLRGNEGKQSTLKILVEKLLKKFSATVRTKSILLDTTHMKENLSSRSGNLLTLADNTFEVNGLYESVSGDVKLLSEDLEEQTSVIKDVEGRIEEYDDVYTREYKSGLIPKLGDTFAEQRQRITESHNDIEITKHTYAPTKLAEITQGNTTTDTARLAMAFIFQSLIRKLSAGTEISGSCVVNAIFHGLSSPKTFTIGECIALIFYALRKQDWYTYKNKYGEQVFHRNDLWKSLVDADNTPISVGDRNMLISSLTTYEDCRKYNDPNADSYCDHSFYTRYETFNDSIPSKADVWLPYLGQYTKYDTDELVTTSLPRSVSGLDTLIENPNICISGRTLLKQGTFKQFMQILSPYEYSSLELKSWNDMCDAEAAGTVPVKYDSSLGAIRTESHSFQKVSGSTTVGGSADGTLVGGIVTGSSRSPQDKWFIKAIPDVDLVATSHEQLINSLTEQANTMIDHYQLTRSMSDAFFHFAMAALYKHITITDKIKLDLVPGYTTYSEWFESDIELKSVFRTIEEGADQASIYGSIADNLISALFPADKIVITGSVDQTKYAAMKELFQWLGSYNIAYLNTSSVQYETLFLHPITINATHPNGNNDRPWLCDCDKGWFGIGTYIGEKSGRKLECWSTSQFEPGLHKHYWSALASGWSLSNNLVKESAVLYVQDPVERGSNCVSLNGLSEEQTHILIYGSSEDALEIPVYKESDIKSNENSLVKSGITKSNFYFNHKSSWTSLTNPSANNEWATTADFTEGTKSYLVHENGDRVGTNCDDATAILLYGSVENASKLPHFKVAYKTFKQQ